MMLREATITYRRMRSTEPARPAIRNSLDAARIVASILPDAPTERFAVLAVDSRGHYTGHQIVGHGGAAYCPVAPADIARFLLLAGSPRCILAHNHPSGDPTPSPEDIELTQRVVDAFKLLGLQVLDHIIVGEPGHAYSFLDAGILPR